MIGTFPLVASISPTTMALSIIPRLAKPYSFYSFTGFKLLQAEPCLLAMPWRAGTLKDAEEVEIEIDIAADVAEVNGFPELERKLEGEEEEEMMEVSDSHGKKKKKADDLEAKNYDRFKMNNGREERVLLVLKDAGLLTAGDLNSEVNLWAVNVNPFDSLKLVVLLKQRLKMETKNRKRRSILR